MPAADPASPTVPVDTLAKLFGITTVRVQQLTKLGVVVKAERGRYELWPSIKGYVRYLQERAVGKGVEDGDASDYQKHRTRLYKARADQAEIEAALLKGTVHEGKIIAEVWGEMIGNARARFLALPKKAAGKVVSTLPLPTVEKILEEHCHEALNELASYDPSRLIERTVAEHRAAMGAAADLDPEPVGRQEAEAVE